MKILFISEDLVAGDVARLLVKEGHDVKLFIKNKYSKKSLIGFVNHTHNWEWELGWVGKDGLIVFDGVCFGTFQDKLRKKGYTVFGGSELGDKLEQDREYAQSIFEKYGMKTAQLRDFVGPEKAIEFVKKNPGKWVIKQNGLESKNINYIGKFDDGRDVINVLENYISNHKSNKPVENIITLQRKVVGVELAVCRYFNGFDWVGPIEINIEHKKFLAGDVGPTTSEMGTIAWYEEKNKLFDETLGKLKKHLIEIDYRGVIDINCIVNDDGAFPLEATMRFGSPIVHLQTAFHIDSWFDILYNVAIGKEGYNFKCHKGYGVVNLLAVPPFPYSDKINHFSFLGKHIYLGELSNKLNESMHFEDISIKKDYETGADILYISDHRGYVMYVSAISKELRDARKKSYNLIKDIHIPKMLYRIDIGLNFLERDQFKLKEWGYVNKLQKTEMSKYANKTYFS